MNIEYWNAEVQRGWKGELRTEMLEHNVFCYGKHQSGKTEKVAIPFLRHAMENGRSVLLILPRGSTQYNAVIDELVPQFDYECKYHHAEYYESGNSEDIVQTGLSLARYVAANRCVMLVYVDETRRFVKNTSSTALGSLLQDISWRDDDLNPVSVIIENADWCTTFPPIDMDGPYVNFCITAGGEQLSPWVKTDRYANYILREVQWDRERTGDWEDFHDEVGEAMKQGDQAAVMEKLSRIPTDPLSVNYNVFDTEDRIFTTGVYHKTRDNCKTYEDCLDLAVDSIIHWCHAFFEQFQTVICTGGIPFAPNVHKLFIRCYFVGADVKAPAGKFLVTDLTTTPQPSMSVFPKTVLRAGKEDVENIFRDDKYAHGGCILERNGSVMLHASTEGTLEPMVFSNYEQARRFLCAYMVGAGFGLLEPVEMDGCSVRFLLPTTNEEGRQDEIMLSYIQKGDIEAYVDQTMMLAMEIEEYLHDKQRQAEVPGLDMAKDAPNVSLQKIIYHVNRTHRKIRKLGMADIPIDDETNQQVASMAQEYVWVPYRAAQAVTEAEQEEERSVLPSKRVLFLGGHINMVKKLRQIFPGWQFLTDDELSNWTGNACDVIFFWTKHCSHLVMQYVNARKDKDTPYIYVTATNTERLISEMSDKYKRYLASRSV